MRIPILLIQLSPIIFSKSDGCLGRFILGAETCGLGAVGAVITGFSVGFSAEVSIGLSTGFSAEVFTVFAVDSSLSI